MVARKHPRFSVQVPVIFSGNHRGSGVCTDLSRGGCCVERSTASVEMGKQLTARLYIVLRDAPLQVRTAMVRWSIESRFGLQFMSIEAKDKQRLKRYIDNLSIRNGLCRASSRSWPFTLTWGISTMQ